MKRLMLVCTLWAWPASASPVEDPPGSGTITLVSAAHFVAPFGSEGRESCPEFRLDKAPRVTFVVASPVSYEARILLPDGGVLSAETADGRAVQWHDFRLEEPAPLLLPGLGQGANSVVLIERPLPGPYQVCLRARDTLTEPTAFAVTMLPASEVRMGLALAEPEALARRPVAVGAMLLEGARPIERASLLATITRAPDDARESTPQSLRLELSDRGEEGDTAAGDGLFAGLFVPEVPGRYWVQVRASGRTSDGLDFQRDVGGVIVVGESEPVLEGRCQADGVDEDGNGRFEALRVRVAARLRGGTAYDVVVELRAGGGQTVAAHSLLAPDFAGSEVDVDFAGSAVRSLRADGRFTVSSVRLDEITGADRLLRDRVFEACVTPAFRMDEFEEGEEP